MWSITADYFLPHHLPLLHPHLSMSNQENYCTLSSHHITHITHQPHNRIQNTNQTHKLWFIVEGLWDLSGSFPGPQPLSQHTTQPNHPHTHINIHTSYLPLVLSSHSSSPYTQHTTNESSVDISRTPVPLKHVVLLYFPRPSSYINTYTHTTSAEWCQW